MVDSLKIPTAAPPSRTRWLLPVFLVCLGAGVYANATSTPFVFDDKVYIVENKTLANLTAPTRLLPPYPNTGYMDDNTRPVVFLTLAINHALSGNSTLGYHLTNILIHLLAALTLYGILWRVFLSPKLRDRLGANAHALAFTIAALWVVQPLNTMAVTYLWQRCESLMGLFYLLTIYTFWRGATSPRGRIWFAASIFFCLLGMGSKEVMVSAPLFILLLDRALLAGTFKSALKERWRVYAGLFATLGFLACLSTNISKFHSNPGVGFKTLGGALQYLATMPKVYCFYLLRAIWPTPLCLDHYWSRAVDTADLLPYVVPVSCALAATIWAFFKRPAWSLPGLGILLILAPTSSIMPMPDLVCEYRVYLPLTFFFCASVCGIYIFITRKSPAEGLAGLSGGMQRLLLGAVCFIIGAFGYLTLKRNFDYSGEVSLWRGVVQQYPDNPRGHFNLANGLTRLKRYREADEEYRKTLRLAPWKIRCRVNMGANLTSLGRNLAALETLRLVILMEPTNGVAQLNFATALLQNGENEAALPHLRLAAQLLPTIPSPQNTLGYYWFLRGDYERAKKHFVAGLRLDPNSPELQNNLGNVYKQQGKTKQAIECFRTAVRLKPNYLRAYLNLGGVLESSGQLQKAREIYRRVLALQPGNAEAQAHLSRQP